MFRTRYSVLFCSVLFRSVPFRSVIQSFSQPWLLYQLSCTPISDSYGSDSDDDDDHYHHHNRHRHSQLNVVGPVLASIT